MKEIFVDLGKDSYNITIDNGILNNIGTLISKVITPRKAIIVTDKIVDFCLLLISYIIVFLCVLSVFAVRSLLPFYLTKKST